MISLAAVRAEFETADGLKVEVTLKVSDPSLGAADAAIADLLGGIENYIADQNQLVEEPEPMVLIIHHHVKGYN